MLAGFVVAGVLYTQTGRMNVKSSLPVVVHAACFGNVKKYARNFPAFSLFGELKFKNPFSTVGSERDSS